MLSGRRPKSVGPHWSTDHCSTASAVVTMGRSTRTAFWLLLPCLLWLRCPYAFALNPGLEINQYAHTARRVREGFGAGDIYSIAQTPDGFLWLGTDAGLMRFDGVSVTHWQVPEESALPDSRIHTLLGARYGTLWIGTLRRTAS